MVGLVTAATVVVVLRAENAVTVLVTVTVIVRTDVTVVLTDLMLCRVVVFVVRRVFVGPTTPVGVLVTNLVTCMTGK